MLKKLVQSLVEVSCRKGLVASLTLKELEHSPKWILCSIIETIIIKELVVKVHTEYMCWHKLNKQMPHFHHSE